MKNKNTNISTNLPFVISGIDTLYFFYESNKNYDEFYRETLNQLQSNKQKFESQNISFENRDLKISLQNNILEFNGKAQGFYWFSHSQSYFSVGFKQGGFNERLHNIQIQLNTIGIYTIGIKALLQFIDGMFANIVTGYKPITRADLNIFVQADLSWLSKEMFVSRKRKYIMHSKEISSKHRLETLYIGRQPFSLRLYDKKAELKNSSKKEMMLAYFSTNGFELDNEIFNIEFECHRKFLKSYEIDTVEDLLCNAQELFRECMDAIRLVDISSISKNALHSSNRYKAHIHPLWSYLRDTYKLKEFLSDKRGLLKMVRPQHLYTVEQAIKEHIDLAKKARLCNIVVDEQFYHEVMSARGITCAASFRGHCLKDNKPTNDSTVGLL